MDAGPNQQPPVGLTLNADGTITGTPTAAGTAVYSFLVKAVDANGRQDTRGFSIKLRPALPVSGGCSGTGLEPVALSLLALIGLGRRRR
jgi:hypothetical protein